MGRAPCCDKANVKKGPWSPEEDAKLKEYIDKNGTGGNWIALPQKAGLKRCGKSCRLRWLNYLRPNIKHGDFTDDEDRIICSLFANIGSRWSIIAAQLPGRTDNDIKNYWNTKLKKKLMGTAPSSQKRTQQSTAYSSLSVLEPLSLTSSPYSAPSPALSSARSAYTCSETNYYPTPARSFTGYEIFSVPPGLLNTTCSSSISAPSALQPQGGYMSSMHNYLAQDNFLRFGGEASSSSSDGSSAYDYGSSNGEHVNLQSYLCNGVYETNQKLIFSGNINGCANEQKPNGSNYVENPLDCSLEEIKQLISTNLCNNFFVDEIKTEEKVTYY